MVPYAWPFWWTWELELSTHLLLRMLERDFTEVDVRRMLEDAEGFRPDIKPGRFAIATRHDRGPWEVIVEPDPLTRTLVVITAYPAD